MASSDDRTIPIELSVRPLLCGIVIVIVVFHNNPSFLLPRNRRMGIGCGYNISVAIKCQQSEPLWIKNKGVFAGFGKMKYNVVT